VDPVVDPAPEEDATSALEDDTSTLELTVRLDLEEEPTEPLGLTNPSTAGGPSPER
jgi:hypothetical protein